MKTNEFLHRITLDPEETEVIPLARRIRRLVLGSHLCRGALDPTSLKLAEKLIKDWCDCQCEQIEDELIKLQLLRTELGENGQIV